MTGKSKKELQSKNATIKKTLSDIKLQFSALSTKYANLQERIYSEKVKKKQDYSCEKCVETFASILDFKNRKKNHEERNDKFKCDVCVRIFDEEWKMKAHLKISHRKNECQKCGESFKFVDTLANHVKITHDNVKIYCHYLTTKKFVLMKMTVFFCMNLQKFVNLEVCVNEISVCIDIRMIKV